MKSFAITSAKFSGDITYTYDNDGYLQSFINNADLSQEQRVYILKKLPLTQDEIKDLMGNTPSLNIVEIPFKVSFEQFWDKYDDKIRSSKKKSLQKWSKMTDTDMVKAYLFIEKYNRNRGNADKKYAETYLNSELWNN